jgi:hypothetical protein
MGNPDQMARSAPVLEKIGGRTKKWTCKPLEEEEYHEKGPRWSWARNQMGIADENPQP